MSTKSDPGAVNGGGYQPTASSSSRPADSGPGSGRITVDTDSIFRGAAHFSGAGEDFRSFANGHQRFLGCKPLVNGETDDSWGQFEPSYQQGTMAFIEGAQAMARAVDQMHESLNQFAAFCVATEDNAECLGRNALNLNAAQPTQQEAVSGLRPTESFSLREEEAEGGLRRSTE